MKEAKGDRGRGRYLNGEGIGSGHRSGISRKEGGGLGLPWNRESQGRKKGLGDKDEEGDRRKVGMSNVRREMARRRKREWPRDRERQGRRRRIANGFKMAWRRIGIGHRSGGQGREKMIGHGTRKGKEERK